LFAAVPSPKIQCQLVIIPEGEVDWLLIVTGSFSQADAETVKAAVGGLLTVTVLCIVSEIHPAADVI